MRLRTGGRQAAIELGPCRATRTKLSAFGFVGITNRLSSDIGREFGGDARELGREPNQRRSENNDSNCS